MNRSSIKCECTVDDVSFMQRVGACAECPHLVCPALFKLKACDEPAVDQDGKLPEVGENKEARHSLAGLGYKARMIAYEISRVITAILFLNLIRVWEPLTAVGMFSVSADISNLIKPKAEPSR